MANWRHQTKHDSPREHDVQAALSDTLHSAQAGFVSDVVDHAFVRTVAVHLLTRRDGCSRSTERAAPFFSLVLASTEGCYPLPTVEALEGELRAAGFTTVVRRRLFFAEAIWGLVAS